MKKRLLSAALALAMVLTLIPVTAVPAFAVDSGVSVNRAMSSNATINTAIGYGDWYWTDTSKQTTDPDRFVLVSPSAGAFVNSIGNSGTYYASISDYHTKVGATAALPTNMTLLGDFSVGSEALPSTFSVNVNGYTLSMPSDFNTVGATAAVGTLNITNPYPRNGSGGAVSGTITRTYTAGSVTSALNINVTDASVGGISLTGVGTTINLNNVSTTGAIQLNGAYRPANATADSYVTQTLQANRTGAGTTTLGGGVTITNGSSARVDLNSVLGGQTINVTSHGGSVAISGSSNVGKITVQSRATSAAPTVNANIPSVTVSGGTVAGIDQSADYSTNSASITVNGATISAPGISVKSGTVTINNGSTVGGDISVPSGSLIVNSATGVSLGTITMNGTAKRVLDFKNSKNVVQTGAITANNGGTLTIDIPHDLSNSFGTLALDNTYTSGGILGGVFQTQADDLTERAWFGSSVKYAVKVDSSKWAYWNDNELSQAIASVANTSYDAKDSGNIILVGHANTKQVVMKNGSKVAQVGFSRSDSFTMPQVLLGDAIVAWTLKDTTVPVSGPDNSWQFSTSGWTDSTVEVFGQDAPVQMGATKLESVKIAGGDPTYTSGIRVGLVNNVITLSGAVTSTGGYTDIPLELTTDARDANNDPITANVIVTYNSNTKSVTFAISNYTALAEKGIILNAAGTSLSMNNGKNVYTLNGSGLGVPAPNLNTAYNVTDDVLVTVTKSGYTQQQKNALATSMADPSTKQFNWRGVPAMEQAINAAQLTINNKTTVDNWVNTARTTVWRQGFKKADGTYETNMAPHTGNYPTAGDATIDAAFGAVYLVPYLQVTVTDYNPATGYMTLTLTPSYRVDVSASSGTYDPTKAYTVQAGRSLGAITGDFGSGVTVSFKSAVTLANNMHQDSTYVYAKSGTNTYTITHGSNNGLGSMVINSTPATIEMKTQGKGTAKLYDSLQAAVDDTEPQTEADGYDVVTVKAGYGGNGALTMSGKARIIKVNVEGNTIISSAASGDLVQVTGAGHDWTVQLLKDTNVATNGNITISSATGGSASVNANPASVGQTVTITLSPNAGYVSSGVTVRTASGASVSVSGSGNTYTFVMPSGTVTVTPSFTASQTIRKATVSVSPNSMGTTTTTAAATNNQVDAGSNVGVTTNPASGYRTMGVNISTNGGAATAVRQGDNYFTFTVPANATAVTVTPIYDRDNGTKFSDVWSTEYYSNPVAWAVGRNITNGTSTYTFSPSVTCTRAQMMTFLWRAAGRPTVSGANNPFVDVYPSMGSDYYSAILWAVSKGITNGVDSTHFGPSQTVSRAQAVTFLYRYAGSPSASTYTGFTDAPSSEYYARAVSWANAKGITNGKTSTTFAPSWGVTRAEAVTFLYRHITGLTA